MPFEDVGVVFLTPDWGCWAGAWYRRLYRSSAPRL